MQTSQNVCLQFKTMLLLEDHSLLCSCRMQPLEKKLIQSALEKNKFNVNRSAELLKMTRHSLRYRMQQLGVGNSNKSDDKGGR